LGAKKSRSEHQTNQQEIVTMTISKEEFAKLNSSEQGKVLNQLLKKRTFQIAREELASSSVNLPVPEDMDEAEKETNELLEKAKKGSTVYQLLKLQIKSFKQTRRIEKDMKRISAQELRLAERAKKLKLRPSAIDYLDSLLNRP
jgi:hypothetical protein